MFGGASYAMSMGSLKLIVVASSPNPIYQKLLVNLEVQPIRTIYLSSEGATEFLEKQISSSQKIGVVSFGPKASEYVFQKYPKLPHIFFSINPEYRFRKYPSRSIGISMVSSLQQQLRDLNALPIEMSRIGLFYNKESLGRSVDLILKRAPKTRFKIHAHELKDRKDILEAAPQLFSKIQLFWIVPDWKIYNTTTLKYLIKLGRKHNVILLGFSSSFIQAGVELAHEPNYEAINAVIGSLTDRQFYSDVKSRSRFYFPKGQWHFDKTALEQRGFPIPE